MDIASVHGNKSWKFHDDTIMGTWWKRCDGRTDGQTDGWTDWTSHIAAWSQLKIHINWILGFKCDNRIWHWPWPWFWIFTVNLEFAISQAKMVWLSKNEKSTQILWTEDLNDYQVWPSPWLWKVRCNDQPDSDWGDSRGRHAVESSSFVRDCISLFKKNVFLWMVAKVIYLYK